jgi:hypothetical protein
MNMPLEAYLTSRNIRKESFSLFFIYGAGVEPSPLLLRPFVGILHQPWMIDGDDCGVISGVNQWQGNPKYSEDTCPMPRCPPQTPQDLTLASTVGSRQLTVSAREQPCNRIIVTHLMLSTGETD